MNKLPSTKYNTKKRFSNIIFVFNRIKSFLLGAGYNEWTSTKET